MQFLVNDLQHRDLMMKQSRQSDPPYCSIHATTRSTYVHYSQVPPWPVSMQGGLQPCKHFVCIQVPLETFASQLHSQIPVLLMHCFGNSLCLLYTVHKWNPNSSIPTERHHHCRGGGGGIHQGQHSLCSHPASQD